MEKLPSISMIFAVDPQYVPLKLSKLMADRIDIYIFWWFSNLNLKKSL